MERQYKIAIIGNGKTGQYVEKFLEKKCIEYTVFNSKCSPDAEVLKSYTHAIIFVPGVVFENLIDILVKSRIKVITGATGFNWPKDFNNILKKEKLTWLHSTNFALGMNLVRLMLETLSKADQLFDKFDFSIHEVHHIDKKDAPSGTAISWSNWIKHKSQITCDRTGDVIGDHSLELTTQNEKITVRHEALDRSIFAQGAIWSLKHFHELQYGLNEFSKLSLEQLLKE